MVVFDRQRRHRVGAALQQMPVDAWLGLPGPVSSQEPCTSCTVSEVHIFFSASYACSQRMAVVYSRALLARRQRSWRPPRTSSCPPTLQPPQWKEAYVCPPCSTTSACCPAAGSHAGWPVLFQHSGTGSLPTACSSSRSWPRSPSTQVCLPPPCTWQLAGVPLILTDRLRFWQKGGRRWVPP